MTNHRWSNSAKIASAVVVGVVVLVVVLVVGLLLLAHWFLSNIGGL